MRTKDKIKKSHSVRELEDKSWHYKVYPEIAMLLQNSDKVGKFDMEGTYNKCQ